MIRICEQCKRNYDTNNKKRKFCSRKCYEKYFSENYRADRCPTWKGGRHSQGRYMRIYSPSHPNCNNKGYVYEHRLVMEKHIGRTLLEHEIVHHVDNDPFNNKIENLILTTKQKHIIEYHEEVLPNARHKHRRKK